ncbi:MAG: nucleotidyl transferase AbiEii/AbiGii toxin family protein [Parcubacteria group bacterium]
MIDIKLHRKYLFNILSDIYSSPVGAYLGFKGGTMFYYFQSLDRFSVDLDFDLLDETKANTVQQKIKEILEKYGEIIDEKDKFFNIFLLLSYQKGQQGIKVEISKRNSALSRYETKNFYGKSATVLNIEDAFAQKLVAATDRKRTASRDFYDIYFLLKNNFNFNEKIIQERTGKDAVSYFRDLKKFIGKNITERSILAGLGELMDPKQKDWAKKNLKKELLSQINFWLSEAGK